MHTISYKTTIPLVVLLVLLCGGVYLYQKNSDDSNQLASSSTSADLNSSSDSSGIVLGDNSSASSLAKDANTITDGQTYNAKITEIRKPINQGFQDLSEKAKYTTLFPSEEIQRIIDDTRKNIESGIDTLTNLSIDEKLRTANDLHIKSLNLLLEAINSYNNARQQTDKKEAQRLSELFSYDIEQSNNILKNIQIPK